MVTDDLVELHQICAVLLQPGRETVVQRRAHGLGQRLVGRVADQQVAEAVRLVVDHHGALGPDEVLAHEHHQAAVGLRILRRERHDRAAVEDLALHRAALEHASLARLELVEARSQQRLDRRRHRDVPHPLLGEHRNHLLDEERVAAGGLEDPLAQRRVESLVRQEGLDQLA